MSSRRRPAPPQTLHVFDRVVVLNLPYKPDRREKLDRLFRETGIADPEKVQYFKAISGDWVGSPAWFEAGPGAWGCLMSHLHVLHQAVMDGVESLCVLEDDVCFHPRSTEILGRFWAELPGDWEQLYLGGQHLEDPEEIKGKPFLLRGRNVNRTHAYVLKRPVFSRFQNHIMHAPDYIRQETGWHIDHQLGIAHERQDWNVYCPMWWLAGQDEGPSNISGNTNPRYWWQPGQFREGLPFIHLPAADGPKQAEQSRPQVHCGHNLKPGTCEDVGLDACVKKRKKLREFLVMIAGEAIDLGVLPGWQHPQISAEEVRRAWPAGAIEAADADFGRLLDYPFNGLFPHPVVA